ncbi:MAG: AraC family transcriptional regulator [Rikenellaceae bacterium]
MNNVINEISPLSEKDCFYIVERFKKEFTYPIHRHKEFELNFVENGAGVVRIIGDSVETITDYDLVLICSENLEHTWSQGECQSESIREITIQFSNDMFPEALISRNQFDSIRKMLDRAQQGLAFSLPSIMKVYSRINSISEQPAGFDRFLYVFKLLHELSVCTDCRTLSNKSFAQVERDVDSRRVTKIYSYINAHYSENITLETMAGIVKMTPPAFSRFFKLRTGRNLSDYITDIRLGAASRMLIDTTTSISEICYDCGFNNISNFNRIFKKRKNVTPKEFRNIYNKKKITI